MQLRGSLRGAGLGILQGIRLAEALTAETVRRSEK